jgi:hypothetical protein
MLQAGSSPDEVDLFNLPNTFSRTMALGSTQPLTELITGDISGGKGRPACKAENLTAICEPIIDVSQLYGPRWHVTGIRLPSFILCRSLIGQERENSRLRQCAVSNL